MNLILMVLIYQLEDLTNSNKYTVLVIFGLIKYDISGLGFTFNLLSQSMTSL